MVGEWEGVTGKRCILEGGEDRMVNKEGDKVTEGEIYTRIL